MPNTSKSINSDGSIIFNITGVTSAAELIDTILGLDLSNDPASVVEDEAAKEATLSAAIARSFNPASQQALALGIGLFGPEFIFSALSAEFGDDTGAVTDADLAILTGTDTPVEAAERIAQFAPSFASSPLSKRLLSSKETVNTTKTPLDELLEQVLGESHDNDLDAQKAVEGETDHITSVVGLEVEDIDEFLTLVDAGKNDIKVVGRQIENNHTRIEHAAKRLSAAFLPKFNSTRLTENLTLPARDANEIRVALIDLFTAINDLPKVSGNVAMVYDAFDSLGADLQTWKAAITGNTDDDTTLWLSQDELSAFANSFTGKGAAA